MQKLLIMYPDNQDKAYKIAADEFAKYFKQMTGYTPQISVQDDNLSDLVLIGAPAVNAFVAKCMLGGELPCINLRAGTDDFAVKTCSFGERKVLLLQGGLGRATLYAVYAYFEQNGCGWFWDGDYVPKMDKETLWGKDFDILETMRFQYRGIRYFAHRGCKRFRAETWDFNDWKREIDYLAKRRLNLFMLRIGQDDLFQRAFPDDVKYPTPETMDALTFPPYDKCSLIKGGYSDRRLFWSLQYRGELRKKVLAYAFERGFMHPEDCGTMTHWNTLTPLDFIENKKPKFFNETYVGTNYGNYQTGQVWDIREDKEFAYYMQLTKAHIHEYGKAEIFHTIGFAERMFSEDRKKNLQMKRYVYDRYLQALKTEYPTCPVLIASWDLWLRYTSAEVTELVNSLDKTQSIIFDYTSDSPYENNFTRWNVVGNFPYVFGIFHAYASFTDCLGFYSLTEQRMQIAKADEYCKGIIYWPELSHSDTLMQEFFMENAWEDQVVGVRDALKNMCTRRYGEYALQMQRIWEEALPIIQLMHWTMRADPDGNTEYYFFTLYRRYMPWIFKGAAAEKFADGMDMEQAKAAVKHAKKCFRLLCALPNDVYKNEFIYRDIADIARTLLGRYANINLIWEAQAIVGYQKTGKGKAEIYAYANHSQQCLSALNMVLSAHSDFSLYHTLAQINESEKVYDGFEETLKNNTVNAYCMTANYESVKEILVDDLAAAQKVLMRCVEDKRFDESSLEEYFEAHDLILRAYLKKPLRDIDREEKFTLQDALQCGCALFENM